MIPELGTRFEQQKVKVSPVLALWHGFWGANAEQKTTGEFQKNTAQSKAETDGGLRDEAATSRQKI